VIAGKNTIATGFASVVRGILEAEPYRCGDGLSRPLLYARLTSFRSFDGGRARIHVGHIINNVRKLLFQQFTTFYVLKFERRKPVELTVLNLL
jgi:hypothetical protein